VSDFADTADAGSTTSLRVDEVRSTGSTPRKSSAPRRRSRGQRRWLVFGLQILVLLVLAGSWQWLSTNGTLPEIYTSRPTLIVSALVSGLVHGSMLSALGTTMVETVVGFAIASVAGLLVAVAFYFSPLAERVFRPYLTAANNMPRLALTSLFVLWLGVGTWSHIVLVITMVFFVVFMNSYSGFTSASRDNLILAKVLGASRMQLFTRFLLPGAVPSIFVGLQLGLTYSFMGAVIGEIITGGNGLGALISTYSATFNSAGVFADLLLMAIVATILSTLIRAAETRLLRWRRHELRGLGA
jgi:NitT/TauT family transport system permease protein